MSEKITLKACDVRREGLQSECGLRECEAATSVHVFLVVSHGKFSLPKLSFATSFQRHSTSTRTPTSATHDALVQLQRHTTNMTDLCYNCGVCHFPHPCKQALQQCTLCHNFGHSFGFCPLGPIKVDPNFKVRNNELLSPLIH